MAPPMKLANMAPATPSTAVIMKPPGSLPGIKNFATIPTINPTKSDHNITDSFENFRQLELP
jgi:hypothetical protein